MSKKYSIIAIAIVLCITACANSAITNSATENSNATAQNQADRGQSVLELEGGKVSVEYGRPALRGRDLEKMISPGQEWRMGSNAATTLTTDVDLKFGDKTLAKGKYILKAKAVDKQQWRLIVHTEDQSPVAEIPMSLQKADSSVELMTIELPKKDKGGSFVLRWGTLSLSTDFQKA